MRKNRLLASLAVAAGLLTGGAAAIIFGPTASSAQTATTQAPSTQAPSTSAPSQTAPGANGTTPPDGSGRQGHNCPNMGGQGQTGQAPATGSSTSGSASTQQLTFRRY